MLYKNVAIENGMKPFPSQGTPRTARLWTIRSKFNAILDMVADSDIHLSKLEAVLERFGEETTSEYRAMSGNYHSSQPKITVGSSGSVVVLRDGEEFNIHDPIGPVTTKGRPRAASRLKSGFEDCIYQKEVKHRRCGNCQELGHYRTGCPLLVLH